MEKTVGGLVAPAARQRRIIGYSAAVPLTTAALLAPAVYNRFPLIFPDTSAYLDVAFYHAWTLDRSGFYGLALKPFVSLLPVVPALWFGLAMQVFLISALLLLFARHVCPGIRPLPAALITIAVAAVSTLPWHVAQLMPDAFAGPMVLVTWMAASRDLEKTGTPLLWLAAAAMALLHYTFLGIMPAVALGTFAVALWIGVPVRELLKRTGALLLCLALVVSAQMAVNGLKFDRWSVSPLGPMFLFARLNEDGLVGPWFDRHCDKDAPKQLCEIRTFIPKDSQVLLWGGPASPFYQRINKKVGEPASWPWVDDLQQAAIGSIMDRPLPFARNAVAGAATQFVHFQALDDECPSECRLPELGSVRPALRHALDDSRQLQNELPRSLIRNVTSAVTIVSLLLPPLLLVIARRREDRKVVSLIIAVAIALMVNAVLTGALSDVHDRYQSRLVWLSPLVCALALLRWFRLNRSQREAIEQFNTVNVATRN
jgi:hypothetical protein